MKMMMLRTWGEEKKQFDSKSLHIMLHIKLTHTEGK